MTRELTEEEWKSMIGKKKTRHLIAYAVAYCISQALKITLVAFVITLLILLWRWMVGVWI